MRLYAVCNIDSNLYHRNNTIPSEIPYDTIIRNTRGTECSSLCFACFFEVTLNAYRVQFIVIDAARSC